MEWLKFMIGLPQVLLSIGTLGAMYIAFRLSRRDETQSLRIRVFTVIAGILVWSGTLVSSYQQAKDQQKMLSLSESNAALSAEIASTTKNQADILTGGENPCHFIAAVGADMVWYIDLRRPNRDAPLYDVTATVTDIGEVWRLHKQHPEKNEQEFIPLCTKTFDLGTLNETDRAKVFRKEAVGDKRWGLYEITFRARNGRWAERLAFAFDDDRGYVAYHVKPIPAHSPKGMEEILFVPEAFPTNRFDMDIIRKF